MATQIISQMIVKHPDDPNIQLSIVRAELDRQNAQCNAEQQALIQMMRKDIQANTAYMQQVRTSRNRFLAAELKKYRKHDWQTAIADIASTIGSPLLLVWAGFWLAGEKLGLWVLRRGPGKRTLPNITPRGFKVYLAGSILLSIWFWYAAITKLIAYIHFVNG